MLPWSEGQVGEEAVRREQIEESGQVSLNRPLPRLVVHTTRAESHAVYGLVDGIDDQADDADVGRSMTSAALPNSPRPSPFCQQRPLAQHHLERLSPLVVPDHRRRVA